MKLGTPGFVGERLRQARVALGLTQASLAMLIGEKTAQSVSHFESGGATPSPETFSRLLTVTRQPPHFFLTPVPEGLHVDTAYFRSMRSLDELARAKAEQHALWLAEYVRYVSEYVEFPSLNLPDFSDFPADPMQLTNDHIRTVAKRLRQHWKLGEGPLPDLVNLLESNGIVVSIQKFDSPKWDAVSFWDGATNTPIILLNSDKPSVFRLRFNLLHELFHLLFHRNVAADLKRHKDYEKKLEAQANRFAGEMAFPLGVFEDDLYAMNLDAMRVIKRKWNFSIAAMIHRIEDLGLVEEREAKNLWVNYTRRKWRGEEPWDKETNLEEPVVLKKAIETMVEHEAQSVNEVRVNGVFSEETQSLITGLGEEFWMDTSPQVKILKMFG